MAKKILAFLLCAVMLACVFAGCGGNNAANTTAASNNAGTTSGTAGNSSTSSDSAQPKHLNVGYHALIKTIDPIAGSWEGQRIGVLETLTRVNDNFELVPWLAESWKQVSDLVWEFTIREGVKFSNGKACDAAAVKAALERTYDYSRSKTMLNIASIEADGLKLTITTNSINAALPSNLADHTGSIVDVDTMGENDIPVGTGPFAIVSWDSPSSMELKKNEYYWGGSVKIDTVSIKVIEDGNAQAMALDNGEVDITFQLPTENVRQFADNPGFNVAKRTGSRSQIMYFNFENELLADVNVRKAIAMAIDRAALANAVNKGDSEAATGIWPVSFSYGQVEGIDYDVDAAKKLLSDAGYADTNGDGILDKDGKALSFSLITYGSHGALLPTFCEAMQDALKEIGIGTDITLNDYAAHSDLLKAGTFDLALNSYIMAPVADPQYFADIMFTSTSDYNYGHYSNAKLDALVSEMDGTFDNAKRESLAMQMQDIINEDCAWFTLGHLKFQSVANTRVSGYETLPTELYFLTANTDIN